MRVLEPLLIGVCFGWLLQKARLGRYEVIADVFAFRDLTVIKFLVSALLTGALATKALLALGFARQVPIPHTYLVGNLVGGVVFGAGMALVGFCPGTVAAGAGEGRLDYLVAGSLGLTGGALLFGLAYPKLLPFVAGMFDFGAIDFAGALHVDGWLLIGLLWEVGLLLFYWLERGPRRIGARSTPSEAISAEPRAHRSLGR